jgi:hypothetical protein
MSKVEFGHPGYWKVITDAFPRFFEIHPRLVASFNSISQKSRETSRNQKIILNLSLLAGIALEELITLVGNGLGPGAMKILRNLLEVSINAEYLRVNANAVDDFLEWFWVEQHRWLNYGKQHNHDLLKQWTPEAVKKIEQEFVRVRPRFEKPHRPSEIRSGWCAVDLGTRAAAAHMELVYNLVNRFSTQFTHGTLGSLLNHFDVSQSSERIDAPPSLRWCAQALVGGHNCLSMVIHTLEMLFNEEASPSSTVIAKDYQYAWNPIPITSLNQSDVPPTN